MLTPIASEVPCSFLFPARFKTHQGWIAVAPGIHPTPEPEPLPVAPTRRNTFVFEDRDYTKGGFYEPTTLSALHDFLVTPLLREAVTYKLAHQIHNLSPNNQDALSPLDVFPTNIADPSDWRHLVFGGWWDWLEQWGQWVSIGLGLYYAYGLFRSALSALFSCRVLYQEHGFSPSLLWGMGMGRNLFPMRFYKRWRRFQAAQRHTEEKQIRRRHPHPPPRPNTVHHEYLLLHSDRNAKRSNTYKSSVRSTLYPTLEEKYVRGPIHDAPNTFQPLTLVDAGPAGVTVTEQPEVQNTVVPTTVPIIDPIDSISPPGPIGEVLRTGTLKKTTRRQ